MPNGGYGGFEGFKDPGKFVTAGIWQSRAMGFSMFGGAAKGAGLGALAGMALAPAGLGAAGAVVGAGLGAGMGALTRATRILFKSWTELERISRTLTKHFRDLNPIIAKAAATWEQVDRQINRAWAQTLAPIVAHATTIGTDLKKRWQEMRMTIFRRFQPWLHMIMNIGRKIGTFVMSILERISRLIERLLRPLERWFERMGLLEIPKMPTAQFKGIAGFEPLEGRLPGAWRHDFRAIAPGRPSYMEQPDWAKEGIPGARGSADEVFDPGLLTEKQMREMPFGERVIEGVRQGGAIPEAIGDAIDAVRRKQRINRRYNQMQREREEDPNKEPYLQHSKPSSSSVGININVQLDDVSQLRDIMEVARSRVEDAIEQVRSDAGVASLLDESPGTGGLA